MRILPNDIRLILQERFQVESAGAMPNLRLVATQTAVNTLLTEDIHDDVAPGFGDIAVRQLAGESSPSLAYAICLDGGTAHIYERAFPTDLENPWELAWTLGSATDVAIEYDGLWQINPVSRCYELITEETPYVFFTDAAHTLYVQKWRDETTRLPLAEYASQISVCRAWRSTLDVGVDQGLVAAYLRGGCVFYRTYAQQPGGNCEWELEREVTELGSGNTTLSLFRTNDFRLGFLTENEGQIKCVLTHRTYAGQAMPSEHADAQVRDVRAWLDDAVFIDSFTTDRGLAETDDTFFLLCDADAQFAITGLNRVDDRHLLFTLSQPAEGDVLPNVTLSPTREILSADFQEGNKLLLTLGADMKRITPFDLTVTNCRKAWWVMDGGRMALLDLSFHADGLPYECILMESAETTATGGFHIDMAVKYDCVTEDTALAEFTATFVLQPVSISPI